MASDSNDESGTRKYHVDTDNQDFENNRDSFVKFVKTDNCDQTALDLSFSHRETDTCCNKITTYVFFDTETTGLQDAGHQPKITEFCLLAVDRGELQTDSGQPRVANKLLICLNPQKVITPIASMITGLFNDHLEKQTPFTQEMAKMVTQFLERLPPPVCLIAHNGNHYDYPLLRSELMQANGLLPESLLCADSLECFREMTSEKVAADMAREITQMRHDAEQTPSKRTIVCEDQAIGAKKPRKDPGMQAILYSDINKEAATRRLDFETADQLELRHSTDDNSTRFTDNKTCVAQHSSDDSNESRMCLKQSRSVVKRLNFMDDGNEVTECQSSSSTDKTTDAGVTDLTLSKSHGCLTNIHKCTFSIGLPTPENSPKENSELVNVTHPLLDNTIHYQETVKDDPSIKTTKLNSSDATNSNDTRCPELQSQSSIADDDFLLAVQHVENQTKCDEQISTVTDIEMINNSERSLENPAHTIVHPELTLSRQSNSDSPSSVSRVSDSSPMKDEMRDIPLPVTKYSPLNISPTTNAQMRNENQQRSDEFVHFRLCTSSTPRTEKASTTTTKSSPVKTFPTRLSFKLQEIYRRCYGQLPPATHNAEDDCVTLLKVVKKNSPQFLNWVDKHAVPFNSVTPMY